MLSQIFEPLLCVIKNTNRTTRVRFMARILQIIIGGTNFWFIARV
jgi:hypothetical protein